MFKSIPDRIVVTFEKRVGKLSRKINNISLKNNSTKETWVCFVPEFTLHFKYTKELLLKKNKNIEIYISATKAVQPNPKTTRKYLDNILNEAIKRQKMNKLGGKLNVLGVSMGNVLAFRFANHFKVNKFMAVAPGSKLPECIFESIATRKIAESSGKNLKAYQKELKKYDPNANLDNLKAKKIKIYLGDYDLMIPYKRGSELVKKMRKKGLKPSVKTFANSGHVETVIASFKEIFK